MSTQTIIHITYGCDGIVVPLELCAIDDQGEERALAFRPFENTEATALNQVLNEIPEDNFIVMLDFVPGQKPEELSAGDLAHMTGCARLSKAAVIHQTIAGNAARLTANFLQKLHGVTGLQNATKPENETGITVFSVTNQDDPLCLGYIHPEDKLDYSFGIVRITEHDSDRSSFRMITPQTVASNRIYSAPIVEKYAHKFLSQCPVIWQALLTQAFGNREHPRHKSCVVVRVGDSAHLQKLKHLAGVHEHTPFLAGINKPLRYDQITGIQIGRNGKIETSTVLDKNIPVRPSLTSNKCLVATQKIAGFLGASPDECTLWLFPHAACHKDGTQ